MRVIRIPVSLKLEEDDFYQNFVEPMREERDLSPFIVNLMKLYYESEAVRDEFDKFTNINNPYTQIKKRIEEISLEHQKTVLATEALKDFVKTAESKVYPDVNKRSNDIKQVLLPTSFGNGMQISDATTGLSDDDEVEHDQNVTSPIIEARLKKLESVLPSIASIESKLDMLLSSRVPLPAQKEEPKQQSPVLVVQSPQTPPIAVVKVTEASVSDDFTTSVVNPSKPAETSPTQQQVVISHEDHQPINLPTNKPTVISTPFNSEKVENAEQPAPTSKPASFGKLLSSVKR